MKDHAKEFERIMNQYLLQDSMLPSDFPLKKLFEDMLKAMRCLYMLLDDAGIIYKHEGVRELLEVVAENDLKGERKVPTEILAEKLAIAVYSLYTLSKGYDLFEKKDSPRG
jgi:hypothetical protein